MEKKSKMILDTATGKWWFLETDEPSAGRGVKTISITKHQPKKLKPTKNILTDKPKNNKSGHKGVYWHKVAGKWVAKIKWKGDEHYGGLFVNLEDAVARATQLREQLHGDAK